MAQLQPDPYSRTKFTPNNKKLAQIITGAVGIERTSTQPETMLGTILIEESNKLAECANAASDTSLFSTYLRESSSYFAHVGNARDKLDDSCKHLVFDPWGDLCGKQIREVRTKKKEMLRAKLAYDNLKAKHAKDTSKVDTNKLNGAGHILRQACQELEDAMNAVLDDDVSRASQLRQMVENQKDFYEKAYGFMSELSETLRQTSQRHGNTKVREQWAVLGRSVTDHIDMNASTMNRDLHNYATTQPHSQPNQNHLTPTNERPRLPSYMEFESEDEPDFNPDSNVGRQLSALKIQEPVYDRNASVYETPNFTQRDEMPNRSGWSQRSVRPERPTIRVKKITARALWDFESEEDGELAMRCDDVIQDIIRLDENWYQGTLNGKTGYFPVNYVEIIS